MTYSVKEAFYSLQGEGAHTGRPAVFCRFTGCNLWSGREVDRISAVCSFCDTDFIGTDGQHGGKFKTAECLVEHILALWPPGEAHRYVIFTGGEPLLQLDAALIDAMHEAGFEVGVETNGTLPAPPGVDWLCVSPKGTADVVIKECDELKLVYPQADATPERFTHILAKHYYLSPMNPPRADLISPQSNNVRATIRYCLAHPKWRLTLQTHKILGVD
ncbi:7-carboxy-7-deazaguanine synthase [Salinispirillum sp. LH 10-3-1]|uniref:7-carboxy-7-deazaguanine synthase n=1 Tax=Salinispirillum sp. LH 10-3-1 TaxID=2952525 RepID=A0AB38YJJ5_9GAMM